jgi:hypothetical protein
MITLGQVAAVMVRIAASTATAVAAVAKKEKLKDLLDSS